MKMSMDEWIEVENENNEDDNSEIWKPETVDESIQGLYVDIEPDTGIDGNSILYHVKNDDEYWKIWGTTVLNSKMDKIEVGSKVKIVYLGKKKGKSGNYYKDFKVLYQKPGGEPSGSSSSSLKGRDKHTMERAEKGMVDEPEILSIVHEQENKAGGDWFSLLKDKLPEKDVDLENPETLAVEWINRIRQDLIGQGIGSVSVKMIRDNVMALLGVGHKEQDLGVLDEPIAKSIFQVLKKVE